MSEHDPEPHESSILRRVRIVTKAAIDVWGHPDSADRFMNRPHIFLGWRTPANMAARSQDEADEVLKILREIKQSGSY